MNLQRNLEECIYLHVSYIDLFLGHDRWVSKGDCVVEKLRVQTLDLCLNPGVATSELRCSGKHNSSGALTPPQSVQGN